MTLGNCAVFIGVILLANVLNVINQDIGMTELASCTQWIHPAHSFRMAWSQLRLDCACLEANDPCILPAHRLALRYSGPSMWVVYAITVWLAAL